jgi:hypothetical protein
MVNDTNPTQHEWACPSATVAFGLIQSNESSFFHILPIDSATEPQIERYRIGFGIDGFFE